MFIVFFFLQFLRLHHKFQYLTNAKVSFGELSKWSQQATNSMDAGKSKKIQCGDLFWYFAI